MNGWTPERRARASELIRRWRPLRVVSLRRSSPARLWIPQRNGAGRIRILGQLGG